MDDWMKNKTLWARLICTHTTKAARCYHCKLDIPLFWCSWTKGFMWLKILYFINLYCFYKALSSTKCSLTIPTLVSLFYNTGIVYFLPTVLTDSLHHTYPFEYKYFSFYKLWILGDAFHNLCPPWWMQWML